MGNNLTDSPHDIRAQQAYTSIVGSKGIQQTHAVRRSKSSKKRTDPRHLRSRIAVAVVVDVRVI